MIKLIPFHRVSLVPSTCKAICLLRSFLDRETTAQVGTKWRQELAAAVGDLDLLDLNYALYRCDQEERDDGHGGGAYVVPGAGAFVYCGLEGIMSMMKAVRDNNDLGHPLCDNLRSGDWLAGYSVNRLRLRAGTKKVSNTIITTYTVLLPLCMYVQSLLHSTSMSTHIFPFYTKCVHNYNVSMVDLFQS